MTNTGKELSAVGGGRWRLDDAIRDKRSHVYLPRGSSMNPRRDSKAGTIEKLTGKGKKGVNTCVCVCMCVHVLSHPHTYIRFTIGWVRERKTRRREEKEKGEEEGGRESQRNEASRAKTEFLESPPTTLCLTERGREFYVWLGVEFWVFMFQVGVQWEDYGVRIYGLCYQDIGSKVAQYPDAAWWDPWPVPPSPPVGEGSWCLATLA